MYWLRQQIVIKKLDFLFILPVGVRNMAKCKEYQNHSYQNRTEPAGSTGSTGNRALNRFGTTILPEMQVNRIEPVEPAGILSNRPVF